MSAACGQGQLLDRRAEVGPGGRLHPVGAVTQVDLVEVDLQQPVLRIPALQLEREQGLLDLPLEAAVRRQEEDLGELLRDGAAALHDPVVAEVGVGGPRDAPQVDAEVGVEAGVLDRDHRVPEDLRDLAQRDEDPALGLELGEQLVVVGVDLGPDRRRVLLERLDVRAGRWASRGTRRARPRPSPAARRGRARPAPSGRTATTGATGEGGAGGRAGGAATADRRSCAGGAARWRGGHVGVTATRSSLRSLRWLGPAQLYCRGPGLSPPCDHPPAVIQPAPCRVRGRSPSVDEQLAMSSARARRRS